MDISIKNIFQKNVYFIILILLIVFIYLTTQNFYLTKNRLETLAKEKRDYIVYEIKESIFFAIRDKIKNLENSAKFLTFSALNGDVNELKKITNIFFNDGLFFNSVQTYINEHYFYAKSIQDSVFVPKTEVKRLKELQERSWYKNTCKTKQTTITVMEPHELLQEQTLNICTPIIKMEKIYGIMCGVIKISSFFENISKTIQSAHKINYFIGDSAGNILKTSDKSTKKEWERKLKEKVKEAHFKNHEFETNHYFVKVYPFEQFYWQIGVGIEKDTIIEDAIEQFMSFSTILFFIFMFLVLTLFLVYMYIQKQTRHQQEEYQYLLAHKARMNEIGELISSINHQLAQPVNSLSLLLSNTLSLSKNNILEKEVLKSNLELCHNTTKNITSTIEIFKNFYKNSTVLTTFFLQDCIQNVLQVMYIELTKNNIKIKFKNTQNIKIHSIENYLQQILLVLIQNAKDALMHKKDLSSREILISASSTQDSVIIEVADYGDGIPNEIKKTLFSQIKTSKERSGSGIGLYFSKKLANDKLQGDLQLKSLKNPTIFSLRIAKDLNKEQ